MSFALERAGILLLRQVGIPALYEGMQIPLGLHACLCVADIMILPTPSPGRSLRFGITLDGIGFVLVAVFFTTQTRSHEELLWTCHQRLYTCTALLRDFVVK
jgi:hypothetical protein